MVCYNPSGRYICMYIVMYVCTCVTQIAVKFRRSRTRCHKERKPTFGFSKNLIPRAG